MTTISRVVPGFARSAVALAAAAVTLPVGAQNFSNESGSWTGSIKSIYSIGAMVRASARDCRLIGVDNGGCNDNQLNYDDGDLNYSRGQVFSGTLKGINDLSVRGPDGWSGFLRLSYAFDLLGDRTKSLDLDSDAKRAVLSDIRFLDAYVSKQFDLGNQSARVRLGNQVLSWGESLFIPGGINATNAIDIRATHRPGAQLKEVILPAPMLSLATTLSKSFSAEAYYQFAWNAARFDPAGSYFSTVDYAGRGYQNLYFPSAFLAANGLPPGSGGDRHTGRPFQSANDWLASGANPAFTPGVPMQGAEPGKNSGQFGLALRHADVDSGNEFGLYYLRYNDKLPSMRYFYSAASNQFINAGFPDSAQLTYAPKRELFGASYNLRAGDWAVGMEASYRPREAVTIDPTIQLPGAPFVAPNCDLSAITSGTAGDTSCTLAMDRKKWQFALTGINQMSPNGSMGWLLKILGAAEGTVLAEAVLANYPNLQLNQGVPYAFFTDYRQPTKTSVGISASVGVVYPNAFGTAVSFAPDLSWQQGVYGYSASALPGFYKGVGVVGLGATIDFKQSNNLKLRLDYSRNYGGGATGANLYLDRDYVSVALSVAY